MREEVLHIPLPKRQQDPMVTGQNMDMNLIKTPAVLLQRDKTAVPRILFPTYFSFILNSAGYYGIKQEECVRNGCCWDPAGEDSVVPWCYHKNCPDPSKDMCVSKGPRLECGYHGINDKECTSRGCCWMPLEEGSEQPWCFFKNACFSDLCSLEKHRTLCGKTVTTSLVFTLFLCALRRVQGDQ